MFATSLTELGLERFPVAPDGNCMFNCMHVWNPENTQQQWRNALCTRMEQRFAGASDKRSKSLKNSLVVSAAAFFIDTIEIDGKQIKTPRYADFEDLMEGMRGKEWGYTEFWEEFCQTTDSTLTTFFSDGKVQFIRPIEVKLVQRNLFVINKQDSQGTKPIPIVRLYCIFTEYIL